MYKFLILIIVIALRSFSIMANGTCIYTQKEDVISKLLDEQINVKKCYSLIDARNTITFIIKPETASKYCSCMSDDKMAITRKAENELLNDPQAKSQVDNFQKLEMEKSGAILRNEIFNTITRMNKFDNLLKRGLIKESDLTSVANCNLENLLPDLNSFKNPKLCPNFASDGGKAFNERLKSIFPEGIEKFKKNITDVGNTLAKNIRAKDSCLTYQNYIELSSPTGANSDTYYDIFANLNWAGLKANLDNEISVFFKYKNGGTPLPSEMLPYYEGEKAYKAIKSDPILDLAVRDEGFFKQVSSFLKKNASGGNFGDGPILEKLASDPEILKSLLKSQDKQCNSPKSSSSAAGGLKNVISSFLCNPRLPPPTKGTLNSDLNLSISQYSNPKESQDLMINLLKKKAICPATLATYSENSPIYSISDEFLSPKTDLDLNDSKNFLKEYKDFSSSFCANAPKECTEISTAKKNKICGSIALMSKHVILKKTEDCIKYLGPTKITPVEFVNKASDPNVNDNDLFTGYDFLKTKNTECENFDYFITTLRRSTPRFVLERNFKELNISIPDKFKGDSMAFIKSPDWNIEATKHADSPAIQKINSILGGDTAIATNSSKNAPLFSDYFANGNSKDLNQLVSFANRGSSIATNINLPDNNKTRSNNDSNSSIPSDSIPVTTSSNELPYSRKFETTGPQIGYDSSGNRINDVTGKTPLITNLDDLASTPSITSTRSLASTTPDAIKKTEQPSKAEKPTTEPKTTQEDKSKSDIKSLSESNAISKNGGLLLTSSSSDTERSNNINNSQDFQTYNSSNDPDAEKLRKLADLKNKLNNLDRQLADLNEDKRLKNESEIKDLKEEAYRLADEIKRRSLANSNNHSNGFSNGDNNNFGNDWGNGNYSNNSNKFNNGYERGHEFDSEKTHHQLDDGSDKFGPESQGKQGDVPNATGASGENGSSKGKGGAGALLSASSGGDEGEDGVVGRAGKRGKRKKGNYYEEEIRNKCGSGPILKCIFPNSYFIDNEDNNRLYLTVANLKLEGKKFQGLEKVRPSKKEMKMGQTIKAQYYLYTYDIVLESEKRQVTNEERLEIYNEIKEHRKDPAFKKKLVKYRMLVKVLPSKTLLTEQEAKDALDRTITPEEYEQMGLVND